MYNRDHNGRPLRSDARNIQTRARPLAYSITHLELAERSKRAFRDFAGEGSQAASTVAEALECSKATAKNYLNGRNVPSGVHDLRALHAIPHYAAMKRELAAMEMDHDPRLQAKFNEFVKYVLDYGEKTFDGEKP